MAAPYFTGLLLVMGLVMRRDDAHATGLLFFTAGLIAGRSIPFFDDRPRVANGVIGLLALAGVAFLVATAAPLCASTAAEGRD